MYALLAGRDVQFESLLQAGADLDLSDRAGDTVLHVAAETNHFREALALLKAGANPAALNDQGVTFQRYLGMTPASVLTDEARGDRDAIETWLRDHNVPDDSTSSSKHALRAVVTPRRAV